MITKYHAILYLSEQLDDPKPVFLDCFFFFLLLLFDDLFERSTEHKAALRLPAVRTDMQFL